VCFFRVVACDLSVVDVGVDVGDDVVVDVHVVVDVDVVDAADVVVDVDVLVRCICTQASCCKTLFSVCCKTLPSTGSTSSWWRSTGVTSKSLTA